MNASDEYTQDKLSELIPIFSETACSSIDVLFGKPAIIVKPWATNKNIDIKFKYILIMGGASPAYQSILTVGVDSDLIVELTKKELGEVEFCDVFGEFANTYCGMLMDQREFTDRFGILNQTVPLLYTKGIPFLPFIAGVQGVISVNGKHIFIGFAIRKK